jgi:uncharacterized repeat protein (TIGR03803 family)
MKIRINVAVSCGLLIALLSAPRLEGQAFRDLHDFDAAISQSGCKPKSSLVQGADGMLYGTTSFGAVGFSGAVYQLKPNGSGFAVIKRFSDSSNEGSYPAGDLVLSGTTLYGTLSYGGSGNRGAVYKVEIASSNLTVLHAFSGSDGANPFAGLVLVGTNLYGTTLGGGQNGNGTVFKVSTNGTGFGVLQDFAGTNGSEPYASLVASGTNLFGSTAYGGNNGQGTLFRICTDGSGFTVLKDLAGSGLYNPQAALTVSGGTLFGVADGGDNDAGAVFQMGVDGSGLAVLKSFAAVSSGTNAEGANPRSSLVLSGGTLYGTTPEAGPGGQGTAFKLTTGGGGFTVLKSFSGTDGADPEAGLFLSGASLFGTTRAGGSDGGGTVFTVTTSGAGFALLKSFPLSDGEYPYAPLVYAGGMLYGVASSGGTDGYDGTLFRIKADGSGFSVLRNFSYNDGSYPYGGLSLLGSTLFGTASSGGASGQGVLFSMNIDGSAFTLLRSFLPTVSDGAGANTNFGGASPEGVTLAGTIIYGTANSGGSGGSGTVFSMQTNGSAFTVLKDFSAGSADGKGGYTNLDGVSPNAGLLLAGATLYGTTFYGGTNGLGTVFKVNTNGSGFSTLKHFSAAEAGYPWAGMVLSGSTLYGTASGGNDAAGAVFAINTNGTGFTILKMFSYSDGLGINPIGGLLLSGTNLYGTCYQGSGIGNVYRINLDGSGYQVLKVFMGNDGAFPRAGVILANNYLYGTTAGGGLGQAGVVYSLSLRPVIESIVRDGTTVTMAWETFANTTYRAQTAPNLASPNWTDVAGDVTGTGGWVQKAITSSAAPQFYRLQVLP